MTDKVISFLRENNIKFALDESMKNHTTFKIGGARKYIAFPDTMQKAADLVGFVGKENIKHCYIGNGSNVIFKDEGFDGLVVKTSLLNNVKLNGLTITVGAGVPVTSLAKYAAENGFSGLEFCYGIPGNVGGGVYMNAGAYGGRISDCLANVTYADEGGNIRTIPADMCEFDYRHSVFMSENFLILSADFSMKKGNSEDMLAYMADIMEKRRAKQPLDKPSAGSSFKRPPGNYAAALIDECGLKGARYGGAVVSEKHAGFIVNDGGATCKDVLRLAGHVKNVVFEKTGVMLEEEMIIIG